MSKDTSIIPYGIYCYTSVGWEDGVYKVIPCPYWSRRTDKPEQENGYCSYLGVGDWDLHIGLLWDQVKECGINEGWEDEDDFGS